MRIISTLLCLIFFCFAASAQSDKTFVSVPVSVSDREGRYISGLKRDDFRIYQDGQEQKISFFATEDEPVSVALLIDTSASTKFVLSEIRQAAKDFINLLNKNDRSMVATFDSEVKVLAPMTSNHKESEKSLEKIETGEREGTVVFNAVDEIVREHFANALERKVIVLLSDGKDFGSAVSRRELLNRLEESDVMIYSIFYQTGLAQVAPSGEIKEPAPVKQAEVKKPEEKKKKKKKYSIRLALPRPPNTVEEIRMIDTVTSVEAVNVLQEISDTTAGRFYMSDAQKLSQIYKQIAGEVRQQYRLGFQSRTAGDADAIAAGLIVRVNRADAVVRARGKYRKRL